MIKRGRYKNGLYVDRKFVVFDGAKWVDLEEAARQEMEETNNEKVYECAV